MSDATDAILDIQEALEEYGSDIVLNIVTEGTYDTVLGEAPKTTVTHNIKALIGNYTSKELNNPDIKVTDTKFRFYFIGTIGYGDYIIFKSKEYRFENIDPKIFQNETLIYTIQGRE